MRGHDVRRIFGVAMCALALNACGTPPPVATDVPVSDEAQTSSTSVAATPGTPVTSGAPTADPYDAAAMAALFPIDEVSIVVWVVPVGETISGSLNLVIEGPNGQIHAETHQVGPGEHESRQLVVEAVGTEAGSYTVSVAFTHETTDITADPGTIAQDECDTEMDMALGESVSVTVVPYGFCFWPTFGLWRTADGTPVSPNQVHLSVGSDHCNWEDIFFLVVGEGWGVTYGGGAVMSLPIEYLVDAHINTTDTTSATPTTVSPDDIRRFAILDELPGDAVLSEFRTPGMILYWSASGDFVYVVTPEHVEQWPRLSRLPGCR